MNKFAILLGLLISVSMSAAAQQHQGDNHDHSGQKLEAVPPSVVTPAGGDIIRVDVNGLVCDFCAQAINKVFRRQNSVADISVDLREKLIVIALKEGTTLEDERLSKLIRDSGYDVVQITRFSPDEAPSGETS